MRIVSFGSSPYYHNLQDNLNNYCKKYGIKHSQLDADFLVKNGFFLEYPNYTDKPRFGYFYWKSFIIRQMLEEDDLILYLDSSVVFGKDPTETILSTKHIKTPVSEFPNKQWIKGDCYFLMECDEEKYWNGMQVWAGCVALRRTEETLKVVDLWCEYSKEWAIISDEKSRVPNFSIFKAHRHDQAILSLLSIKYPEYFEDLKPCFFKDYYE
jgi:hypothetical protein